MANNGHIRVLCLMAADFVAVYVSIIIAAALYLGIIGRMFEFTPYLSLWPLGLLFVVMGAFFKLYHGNIFCPGFALDAVEETRREMLSLFFMYLIFMAFIFMTKGGYRYSRGILTISFIFAIAFVPFMKWITRSILKKYKVMNIRAIIIGAGHNGRIICDELIRNRQFGVEPFAFLDDRVSCRDPKLKVPLIGRLKDATAVADKFNISYAILCLPIYTIPDRIREFSKIFRHIMVIPDTRVFPVAWAYPHQIDGILALELRNQLLIAWPRAVKTLIECILSVFGLIILIPLFLILASVIKMTTKGSVFYYSTRLGLNGKPFKLIKFRTMYSDAEKRLYTLLKEDSELADEWNQNFKLKKDPRITPVGRFLRKTSLDELPQLINVLRGDMAMIGPRPIVTDEIHNYGEKYEILKRVKPGITGLWQVSGRSDTTYERRVILDIHYIMNWNVWMDYYIFIKTIKEVVFCRGAR